MTVELALRTKLARAEETIEDLTRKLEHAQSQLGMATLRMHQAEDTTDGVVEGIATLLTQRCTCANCEHRERSVT